MIPQEPRGHTLAPDEQVKAYYTFGYKVLLLGDKNPFNPYDPQGEDWQAEYVQEEDAVAHARKGGNIGIQMGEVSNWLCAADLDADEARRLAPQFLRETLRAGKTKEKLDSHYVYRSVGADYLQIKDADGKELVGFKAAGEGQGHQIKVAPSTHPAKGRYEWRPAFSPPAILDIGHEELTAAIRRLGVAALIRRYLPDEGRHEYSKAVAGTLLRRGYDADELANIHEVVWTDAGAPRDGIKNAVKNVYDTAQKLEDDKPFTGGTTLNRDYQENLASALVRAAGLDRIRGMGSADGEEPNEAGDDSDLARLWLYKHKNVRHSPHGWLRYHEGWWRKVEEGLITQNILRLMDRTPGKVSANRLKSVATLAAHHSYEKGGTWDANRDIVVCTNGTLDLETFTLRDHRPEDRALGGLPFAYKPDADRRLWDQAIAPRVSPEEWMFLQEFVGYSLTTDCSHELAVWLVGAGGTGKSTFVEGVLTIMGNRAGRLSLSDLDRSSFALENVVGKTLLSATEQPAGFVKHVELLNNIISGEMVSINRKNKAIVDVRSTAKVLWAMNRLPQAREEGSGFFRRIHPVTFYAFEGEKDPQVKEAIMQFEGPGILAWAVEGLKRLRERGAFVVPSSIKRGMAEFEHANDPAAQFVDELCIIDPEERITAANLHETYKRWCHFYGYKPKSVYKIGEDWTRLGIRHTRDKKGRYWGVKFDTDADSYDAVSLGSYSG